MGHLPAKFTIAPFLPRAGFKHRPKKPLHSNPPNAEELAYPIFESYNSCDSHRKPRRHLSCLAGGALHASNLSGTPRRIARDPAEACNRRAHQTPRGWRLVNEIRKLAENVDGVPLVRRSPDHTDDFLLALSEAGGADYQIKIGRAHV